MIGDMLQFHAAFEAERPDEAEAAREFERHREAMWETRHGSLEGYKPEREWPCPGALRAVEETASHLVIECDGCNFATSCKTTRAREVSAW